MNAFLNFFFSTKLTFFSLLYVAIFSRMQEKRRYFYLRSLLYFALATLLHFISWEWLKQNSGSMFLPFSVLFVGFCLLIVVLFNLFCYRCSIVDSLLFSVAAFTTEHFANSVSVAIGIACNLDGAVYRPYGLGMFFITSAVYLLVGVFIFFLVHFMLKERKIDINKRHLAFPVVAVFIVFSLMYHWVNTKYYHNVETIFVTKLYSIAFCVILFLFIISLFESGKYRIELQILEQLERKGLEQYEISKESIAIINTKCHDIKKALSSSFSDTKLLTQEEIASLQEKISIYDNSYVTDNQALNIVLTEKSLYCEKNKINLSVVTPYSDFDFMTKMDIYSLFGNILDNALEAVMKLPVEKRIVSLSVKKIGAMILIHSDNYFAGQLQFEGGSIVTNKKDKTAHGYGILSVRRTAEKYGGAVKISAKEDLFLLDIIIPISA